MGVHLTGMHLIGVYFHEHTVYLISVNLISLYHRHASACGGAHRTAENFTCHFLRSGTHPRLGLIFGFRPTTHRVRRTVEALYNSETVSRACDGHD